MLQIQLEHLQIKQQNRINEQLIRNKEKNKKEFKNQQNKKYSDLK